MRRFQQLSATVLPALLAAAACLGTEGKGRSCACGPEDPPPSTRTPGPAPAAVATSASDPEVFDPDLTGPGWRRLASLAAAYEVCWRPLGAGEPIAEVPRNQDFELEVWVLRGEQPVRGATLAVSAWMPDHGHGMLRGARVVPRADGSFHVEGMLLHMRGHWELRFDVLEGTISEAAVAELEL